MIHVALNGPTIRCDSCLLCFALFVCLLFVVVVVIVVVIVVVVVFRGRTEGLAR